MILFLSLLDKILCVRMQVCIPYYLESIFWLHAYLWGSPVTYGDLGIFPMGRNTFDVSGVRFKTKV